MPKRKLTVAWLRADPIQGPTFDQIQGLPAAAAVTEAMEVSKREDFVAGQILAADGLVVANFAPGVVKYNDPAQS